MKGPGLAILLGMKKGKEKEEPEEMESEKEDVSGMGKNAAAEEVMAAINNGSVEALAESLTNFFNICSSETGEDY